MPDRLPYLSELPTFIPLPPDAKDLTREHAARIFSPTAADDFVLSLRHLAAPSPIHANQHTPLAAPVLAERHVNVTG